jgi:phosphatidylinositol alpha-mannosyltransferase
LDKDTGTRWRTAALAQAPPRRPLRIAHVTEYYYPHIGGVCEHVHFFAREARRGGHHVDVITSHLGRGHAPARGREAALAEGGGPGRVVRIGRSFPVYANGSHARFTLGLRLRAEMRAALRDGDYDVVHVHSPLVPVLPFVASLEATCPIVGTFHAYHERSFGYAVFRPYLRGYLDRLAATIAVSRAATAGVQRYFDIERWRIVPNGVDTALFTPHAERPAAIPDDGVPTVLFVGRFDPRNQLPLLLGAFRRIRAAGTRARLVVVGDGPLRYHYRRLAAGIPDVTFVGRVRNEQRPGYYAHSTVYACPAVQGSFGITLLESMASGTPVVCADTPGFGEVVRHEREALLHRPGDERALADALVRLLDDDTLRQRMATAGRDRARAYDWSRVTGEILDVYRSVLRSDAPALVRAGS